MKPTRTCVGIPGVTAVLGWSVTTTKIELQFGVIRWTWLQTRVPVVMWLQRCELDRLFWPRMSWKLLLRVGSPSDTCRPHLLVPIPPPPPEFPVRSRTGRRRTRACWWKRGAPWQACQGSFRLLLTPHSPAVVSNQLPPNASICWKEGFRAPHAFNHSCLCSFSSRMSSLLVLLCVLFYWLLGVWSFTLCGSGSYVNLCFTFTLSPSPSTLWCVSENDAFGSRCILLPVCSFTKLCLTLCNPMGCSTSVFPVLHHLPEFSQTHVHWVSDPSNHLILCCPLLLPPSVFPSIRVFSNGSALLIRWPKYYSFSISPSDEFSRFSFRIDWFAVQFHWFIQPLIPFKWPLMSIHSLLESIYAWYFLFISRNQSFFKYLSLLKWSVKYFYSFKYRRSI